MKNYLKCLTVKLKSQTLLSQNVNCLLSRSTYLHYIQFSFPFFAQSSKRLITQKKNCDAFIACTKRQFDTIGIFIQHLSDVGLEAKQVFAVTLGPGDNIINTHESLHKVFIYRLYCSSLSSPPS